MLSKNELDYYTTPPANHPDAILTLHGWKDPKTGKIIQSMNVSKEVVQHFHAKNGTFDSDEVQKTTTETLTPDEYDKRRYLKE